MKKQKIYEIKIIQGDLLKHKEDFLVHQTNCVATKSHGLSEQVFKKYPDANLYEKRRQNQIGKSKYYGRGTPGTIDVNENCGVINLLAQLE